MLTNLQINENFLNLNIFQFHKNAFYIDAHIYHLGKGSYVFGSVCLSVCGHYLKSYEWIRMNFYRGVLGSTVKN